MKASCPEGETVRLWGRRIRTGREQGRGSKKGRSAPETFAKQRFNKNQRKRGLTFAGGYGIICFVVSESRREHRGVEQPGSSSGS